MSAAEKRKNLRRTISYPVWIDLGDDLPPRECSLCDASDRGARLVVPAFEDLPEQFRLALCADGSATRLCRVAWRKGNYIGVEYLKEPKQPKSIAAWRAFHEQAKHDAAVAAAEEANGEP